MQPATTTEQTRMIFIDADTDLDALLPVSGNIEPEELPELANTVRDAALAVMAEHGFGLIYGLVPLHTKVITRLCVGVKQGHRYYTIGLRLFGRDRIPSSKARSREDKAFRAAYVAAVAELEGVMCDGTPVNLELCSRHTF